MPELSLDFDAENIKSFRPALEWLHGKYGDVVRVRQSSSMVGWHIWVKGVDVPAGEEIEMRRGLGDCEGRLDGDRSRLAGGLETSRLFTVKGRIYNGQKVVRTAGEWMSYDEWRKMYGEEEGKGQGQGNTQ